MPIDKENPILISFKYLYILYSNCNISKFICVLFLSTMHCIFNAYHYLLIELCILSLSITTSFAAAADVAIASVGDHISMLIKYICSAERNVEDKKRTCLDFLFYSFFVFFFICSLHLHYWLYILRHALKFVCFFILLFTCFHCFLWIHLPCLHCVSELTVLCQRGISAIGCP